MKKQKTTKESVLKMTQGGLLFYNLVIPELKVRGNKCENVKNPFYPDKNGSVSIFNLDGEWFFKDFGNEEDKGDVFVFASRYFDLDCSTDFNEILELMSELDYSEIKNLNVKVKPIVTNKHFELKRRKNDMFKPFELRYFEKYGITENILKEYRVVPLDGFKAIDSKNEWYFIEREKNQVMVAYLGDGFAKIYSPKPKKFFYVGNKPSNYFFGTMLLGNGGFTVLTGGEKDVLTLVSLGYNAFCLNSETELPSQDLLDEYKEQNIIIYSLLDNDETGQRQTKILLEKFGIRPIIIPSSILEKGGKDISEYVELGLSRSRFNRIISRILNDPEYMETDKTMETLDISLASKAESEETEYIPNEVFENLPLILKDCCKPFDDPQEKSMICLSTITLFGALFKNIKGHYRKDYCGSNIYFMAAAPASSGKGSLKFPKLLADKVHKHLIHESLSDSDDGELVTFFIPGNNTSPAILKQLANNNGYGIIWEPEADTLSDALGKEHGSFSDALRKMFHHETISFQRKTGKEYFEIDNPNGGLMLSGTPNQIKRLIPNSENGLLSRFMFFDFQPSTEWDDVFADNNKIDLNKYFLNLGENVFEFYQKLDNLDYQIEFSFTKDQQEFFNLYFSDWQISTINLIGIDFLASSRRLALISFKIGMIISLCRFIDKKTLPERITCTDEDFLSVIDIASCLKYHCISVYEKITYMSSTEQLSHNKQVGYLEALPDKFNKSESKVIADELNIKHKTAEQYLRLFVDKGLLFKLEHNSYSKTLK